MNREEIAQQITKIQNLPNWNSAKTELVNLLNECKRQPDFELLMDEIQNRDWIF